VYPQAQRTGLAPTDFCAWACVPDLEETAVRFGGSGKVVRASNLSRGASRPMSVNRR
jgi:hypothetical protein